MTNKLKRIDELRKELIGTGVLLPRDFSDRTLDSKLAWLELATRCTCGHLKQKHNLSGACTVTERDGLDCPCDRYCCRTKKKKKATKATMQVERKRLEYLLALEAAALELLRMADANGSFMGVAESIASLGKVVRSE